MTAILSPTKFEAFRLSPQQKSIWLAGQGKAQRRTQGIVQLKGDIGSAEIKAALDRVVERHDILRTRFTKLQGMKVPVQVISRESPLCTELDFFHLNPIAQIRAIERIAFSALNVHRDDESNALDAALIRLSNNNKLLVLTLPAMCADTWSLRNIANELSRFLEPSPALLEDPVQYLQFSDWQHEVLDSTDEDAEAGRAHWQQLTRSVPPKPRLPFESLRKHKSNNSVDYVRTDIDPQCLSALEVICAEHELSFDAVLATCFTVLVGTFSTQTELLFQYGVNGRKYDELKDSIGPYASYLPVRLFYDPTEPFLQVVRRTSNLLQEATDYQDHYQIESADNRQDHVSDAGFGFMFEDGQVLPTIGDERISLIKAESEVEQFKLHLHCSSCPSSARLSFQYDPRCLSEECAQRIAQSFGVLLQSAVSHPTSPCGALEVICDSDRTTVLAEWNTTRRTFPEIDAVHRMFEQAVGANPAEIALVYEDIHYTYHQLNCRANNLAHYLRKLDVGAGTVVGLCLDRSAESIVGLLGILKAGGVYVPLDPTLPGERLRGMLQDSGARFLVSTTALSEFAGSTVNRVLLDRDAEAISQESSVNPLVEVKPDDLVYVIFTSGSTGRPKGVAIEHRQLLNYIHGITERLDLPDRSSYAMVSTLAADLGHTVLFPAICGGGTLHLVSSERAMDPRLWQDYFSRHRIDCLKIVPSHLSALIGGDDVGAEMLPHLALVLGGEASRWDLVERIINIHPELRVFNHYGPTETTVGVLTYALKDLRGESNIGSHTVPLGRPLPNSRVYILNQFGRLAPVGVAGEACIGGQGVGRGYLGSSELTASKFVSDPFSDDPKSRLYRSGDLARYLPDGNIEFLGRVDHQIKIRGYRIELGEVESTLSDHPSIKEAVVLARDDNSGEKRLVGYIVPSGASPALEDVRSYLRKKLPEYMVPSTFVFLKQLPLTSNGKVDRNGLPDPEEIAERPDYVPASTPMQVALLSIWETLLGRDGISIHENFFEMGGHSLLATQVISRVREMFQVEVPLRALFESPTVAGMTSVVELGLRRGEYLIRPPLRPASRDRDLPLSFSQRRLWFIDQLESGSALYNVPHALRLRGKLDHAAIQRALQTIVERHEVLRTNYVSNGGDPVQAISPDATFPLPVVDLRKLNDAERESEMIRLCKDEAARCFELRSDRLIRGQILQIADDDQILLITLHHIASDGWSNGVLMHELSTLYNAYCQGLPSPLQPLPIQYADYAVWQREWLQGEQLDRQVDYWKSNLAGAPVVTLLPTDHPRHEAHSFQGRRHGFLLSRESEAALQAICGAEHVTPFMVLLAAFNVLLYRWTGASDLIVGTDVANRTMPQTEGLIGFFLNHLVMRTDVSGDPSFSDLVRRVRETALGAYAHQDLPFDTLVEVLRPERDANHTPIFQVLFVVEGSARKVPELHQLEASMVAGQVPLSKFDIALFMGERNGGYGGLWVYRSELFDEASIVRLSDQFIGVLSELLMHPEMRIEDVDMHSQLNSREAQDTQTTIEANLRGARRRAATLVHADNSG